MLEPKDLKLKRQYLLNNKTPSELRFKWRLDNFRSTLKPKRAKYLTYEEQSIIGFFIPDFVFPTKLILFELDGGYHNTPEQTVYDQNRDGFLIKCGFIIIRIKNEDVDNFDFTILDKYPNFQYNMFKSCRARAFGYKGEALKKQRYSIKSRVEKLKD